MATIDAGAETLVEELAALYRKFSHREDVLALGAGPGYPQSELYAALRSAVYHVYPDCDPDRVLFVFGDSGESMLYAVKYVRDDVRRTAQAERIESIRDFVVEAWYRDKTVGPGEIYDWAVEEASRVLGNFGAPALSDTEAVQVGRGVREDIFPDWQETV